MRREGIYPAALPGDIDLDGKCSCKTPGDLRYKSFSTPCFHDPVGKRGYKKNVHEQGNGERGSQGGGQRDFIQH